MVHPAKRMPPFDFMVVYEPPALPAIGASADADCKSSQSLPGLPTAAEDPLQENAP